MVAAFSQDILAHLKSIFVAGISWKVTQVKPKFTWLTFVRSEEYDPFGLVSFNISLYNHLLWGLFQHFLLFGRILVSKWGLSPNTKSQVFAPHRYKSCLTIFIYFFKPLEKFKPNRPLISSLHMLDLFLFFLIKKYIFSWHLIYIN